CYGSFGGSQPGGPQRCQGSSGSAASKRLGVISMIRPLFTHVLFVLMATLTGVAMAQESSEGAAEELSTILRSYETYQADFIQIVVGENGGRIQETRGSLKAKRPGLFYWETDAPLSQFIVSDGEVVEVYDPDLEQVTIHKLDDRVQTTPALLLSGEVENLDETYEVSQRTLGEDTRSEERRIGKERKTR